MTPNQKAAQRKNQSPLVTAVELMKDKITKVEKVFGRKLSIPHVKIDLVGLKGGLASRRTAPNGTIIFQEIRINKEILEREGHSFLKEVVLHEFAHILVAQLYGSTKQMSIKPHGKEWQFVMKLLGEVPKVTHDYAVSPAITRKQKKFKYTCDCQIHELSSIRHRNITEKGTIYACKTCKKQLVLSKDA